MAYTVSTVMNTVFGDQRVWNGLVTPDAATGTVAIPGANAVVAVLAAHVKSAATENTGPGFAAYALNATPLATSTMGSIGFSGCTTTKVINLTVAYK